MNFSAWSIRNPLATILLFILLTLGGIHAFNVMKIQQFPDLDFPVVMVTVTLPGAAPPQLETDIAKKVESRVASIDGVKKIRGVLQTGASTTIIEFRLEKDLQEALDEVRSAIGEIRSDLPADANEPVISKIGTTGLPLLTFSVSARDMDVLALSWFVDDKLNRRLTAVPGVGSVDRIGGEARTVEVLPDPVKLQGLGLTITELQQQLFALQRDAAGGEAQVGGGKQTIRALGALSYAPALAELQIRTAGGAYRLGDLATIRDGAAEADSLALYDGETVVAFEIVRSRGASETAVRAAVEAELARVKRNSPVFRRIIRR